MIEAATANGVLLIEGLTQHFLPHLKHARQVIDADEIGALCLLRCELLYTLNDEENDSRAKAGLMVGALNAGCYCANASRRIVLRCLPSSSR